MFVLVFIGVALVASGCSSSDDGSAGDRASENLYESREFTPPDSFTGGVEGPAVDSDGNLYAVNYQRQHTIGRVTPDGTASVFVELPEGSTGNGIRFNSDGQMLIADYTGHNVLQVDMETREVSVYAHEPRMNQPNDLAIGANDIVYASDPDWDNSTGQLWRVGLNGSTTLLEKGMGTTNGVEVSPDEETLYVGESDQQRIWKYDLSQEGKISNKRTFITFSEHGLDGMRTDIEGNLYVTRHGKGTIAKISPGGDILREIQLLGENPTNIAFGGPDGQTAYVTVADRGNIETFRVEHPGRSWQLKQERFGE